MAEEKIKVYRSEEIIPAPFPNEVEIPTVSSRESTLAGVYSPTVTKEKTFPKKRMAVELLSQVLNTRSRKVLQEFDLEQSGGFRVGNFKEGVSGDVSITPNGIVGRDAAGTQVFVLDTDGNLALKGEIRSGSLITGEVVVGNNNVIIDGENKQIIINDGVYDRVLIGFQEDGF